jgi:hypothetical protein
MKMKKYIHLIYTQPQPQPTILIIDNTQKGRERRDAQCAAWLYYAFVSYGQCKFSFICKRHFQLQMQILEIEIDLGIGIADY